MDNAKINKKKPNVVDVIVVSVIICGLAAIVFFGVMMLKDGFSFFKEDGDEQPNVEYTFRMSEVDVSLYSITKGADNIVGCPSLQVGDTVYDQLSGKALGQISAIYYEECKASTGMTDENGNLIYSDYPGYVDLIITVQAVSEKDGGVCSVDGYEVRIGNELRFRTYGFCGKGIVEGLAEIEVSDKEVAVNE